MFKTNTYGDDLDLTLTEEYEIPKSGYSIKLPKCSKKVTDGNDLILNFKTFKIYVITGKMIKGDSVFDSRDDGSIFQTQTYDMNESCCSLLSNFTLKYFNIDNRMSMLAGWYRKDYMFADFSGELDFNNDVSGQFFQLDEILCGVIVVRDKNETNYKNIFYSVTDEGIKRADLLLTIKKIKK